MTTPRLAHRPIDPPRPRVPGALSVAALLLGPFLLGTTAGCSTSPCDELADASEEGGCATRARDAPEIECEGDAEIDAECWLDHVRDVCSPSGAELRAVSDCVER